MNGLAAASAPAVEAGSGVLSIRDLVVEFPGPAGAARVVDGVSLQLQRGEALGMVGESGSGKTMIALSMLRLVPDPGRIAGGRVVVNGHDLLALDEPALRRIRGREVGMVFQNPMSAFNPVRSIGRQLAASVLRHSGASTAEAWQRAVEALREVGIPAPEERARSYPHQMSGGMLQRSMIALAMINGPALLVADEPTTALDATIQAQILELLQARLSSAAIVLVTHNLGVAATICRRIAVVYAGRVVEIGESRRLLDEARHPYTQALLRAAPRIDPARPRLESIPGQPPGPRDLVDGCRFAPRCARASARCALAPPLTGDEQQAFACWHPLETRL